MIATWARPRSTAQTLFVVGRPVYTVPYHVQAKCEPVYRRSRSHGVPSDKRNEHDEPDQRADRDPRCTGADKAPTEDNAANNSPKEPSREEAGHDENNSQLLLPPITRGATGHAPLSRVLDGQKRAEAQHTANGRRRDRRICARELSGSLFQFGRALHEKPNRHEQATTRAPLPDRVLVYVASPSPSERPTANQPP